MDKSNLEKIKYGIFADLKKYKKEKLRFLLAFILVVLSYGYSRSDASNSNAPEVTSLSLDNYSPVSEGTEKLLGYTNVETFCKKQIDVCAVIVSEVTNCIKDFTNEVVQEKIYNFLIQGQIDYKQLDKVLELMLDGISPFEFGCKSKEEALKYIIELEEVPVELQYIVVMVREGETYDRVDTSCAGVVSEAVGGGTCYDDAYWTASVLLNRMTDGSYVNKYGSTAYDQFTAHTEDEKYQFSVYRSKMYLAYLGRIDLPGYQAAVNAFYTRKSAHNWMEFRANWVDLDLDIEHEKVVEDGNQYMIHKNMDNNIPYPEFVLEKQDCWYDSNTKVDTPNSQINILARTR